MKLRNKRTGEIKEVEPITIGGFRSLAELNEEWEDVPEEPKEDGLDHIITLVEAYSSHDSERYPKEIVEKLKAVKRLKDKGFKAFSSNICGDEFIAHFKLTNHIDYIQSMKDFDCILDLGSEE